MVKLIIAYGEDEMHSEIVKEGILGLLTTVLNTDNPQACCNHMRTIHGVDWHPEFICVVSNGRVTSEWYDGDFDNTVELGETEPEEDESVEDDEDE